MHIRSKTIPVFLAIAILTITAQQADAGLGSLFSKVAKTLAGKTQKVAGKLGSKGSGQAGRMARSGASTAGRAGSSAGTRLVASPQAVAAASNSVVSQLGTRGALAMSTLTPQATVRLGNMSTLIARSPHRAGWLDAIAKHGDQAVTWLWANKGGVFVGTTATAALLKPADFLATLGDTAATLVEVTGKHAVEPLVSGAREHVVGPAISRAASRATASWFVYPMMTCLVIGGFFWWKFCRK